MWYWTARVRTTQGRWSSTSSRGPTPSTSPSQVPFSKTQGKKKTFTWQHGTEFHFYVHRENGLAGGMLSSAASLLRHNLLTLSSRGSTHRWAYYAPIPGGMEHLARLVDQGKVKENCAVIPTDWVRFNQFLQLRAEVYETFSFDDLPSAYEMVDAGGFRGKVAVDMNKWSSRGRLRTQMAVEIHVHCTKWKKSLVFIMQVFKFSGFFCLRQKLDIRV